MVTTSYMAIASDTVAEIEVKRSRFRCALHRVDNEADARALVEQARKQYWDARHHCTAFIIGPPPHPVERSSDDGEPAGTAGAPMLEVLRGRELSDVAAIVTRWFGGTLLGTGGLARAYADAVRAAADQAGTVRREMVREVAVIIDHAGVGRLESQMRHHRFAVLGSSYAADHAELLLGMAPSREDELATLVAGLTGGSARVAPRGERWVDTLDA